MFKLSAKMLDFFYGTLHLSSASSSYVFIVVEPVFGFRTGV